MLIKYKISIGLFGVVVLFAGCASSRLKADYGNSHRLMIVNQTLNPEAGKNLNSVDGVDNQAAIKSIEKYRKSFETPSPPPTFAIQTMQ